MCWWFAVATFQEHVTKEQLLRLELSIQEFQLTVELCPSR